MLILFVIVLKFIAPNTVQLLFFISIETFWLFETLVLFSIDWDKFCRFCLVVFLVLIFSISFISDNVFKITGTISFICSSEKDVDSLSFSFKSSALMLLSIDRVLLIFNKTYINYPPQLYSKIQKKSKKIRLFLIYFWFMKKFNFPLIKDTNFLLWFFYILGLYFIENFVQNLMIKIL